MKLSTLLCVALVALPVLGCVQPIDDEMVRADLPTAEEQLAFARQLGAQRHKQAATLDLTEAGELLGVQARQGRRAVVDGCGCSARRKKPK